jgi:periplasmic divalent cation tolerance protein
MSYQSPSLRLILTTFADEASAEKVMRQLLEEQLIACGTLLPGARSFYRWKGTIEESQEVVALLKTDEMTSLRCRERLAELHPYEVPEIVQVDPEAVAEPYAAWVRESLRNL